jgi:hypothetical protein
MAAQEAHTAERESRNAWPWPAPPDPGDLSRRIMRRRAELRLSLAQVAGRARVTYPPSDWPYGPVALP